MIKVKMHKSIGGVYYTAWIDGYEENYSIGSSEKQAIGFLMKAVSDRTDIYGGIENERDDQRFGVNTPIRCALE